MQIDIINAINKLTIKINRNYKKIEKNSTIIRKTIIDFSLSIFLFFSIYFKNNFQS